MRKKTELPRKRRRFIKRVIFYSSFLMAIALVCLGFAGYSLWSKLHKPLYISPLPTTHVAQAAQIDQGGIIQQQIENDLHKKQIDFQSVQRQDDSYVITLQDKSKVTFSSEKDIMSQIASLQYILKDLTMEGRAFSSLDLRFAQPVIVMRE